MPHILCIARDSRSYSAEHLTLTCRICGILGVYTLELLQQLPLSILDGSVYHIIQASALVILGRHVKDAIIPQKILDSL
jgi:hypothetical protein